MSCTSSQHMGMEYWGGGGGGPSGGPTNWYFKVLSNQERHRPIGRWAEGRTDKQKTHTLARTDSLNSVGLVRTLGRKIMVPDCRIVSCVENNIAQLVCASHRAIKLETTYQFMRYFRSFTENI